MSRVDPNATVALGEYPGGPSLITDHRLVVWRVARNAEALLTRPHRFFEAATCYAAEITLSLGESGLGKKMKIGSSECVVTRGSSMDTGPRPSGATPDD